MDKRLAKVRAHLQKTGATSGMNNTKWRETLEVIHSLPVQSRYKFVAEERIWEGIGGFGHLVDWLPTDTIELGNGGFARFIEIEWLEVRPSVKVERIQGVPQPTQARQDEIMAALEAGLRNFSIPFTRDGEVLRIVGHYIPSWDVRAF